MKRERGGEPEATAEAFTPRYPAIEQLVDSEDFDRLNKSYGEAYGELERISKQKGLGKAREAKKAMKSLERVMDLLKYLLKLKYQYMEAKSGGQKGEEKGPQKKVRGE